MSRVGRLGYLLWGNGSFWQEALAEKLGARCVSNRFVNSTNTEAPEANPWWDEHVMIFPDTYDWPDGTIDLPGPGY